jgi:dTDP-4-amino-4,6-dideoxygalactose transaminase
VSDRPAILRGTPVRAGKSWPAWPQWDDSEREGLAAVLESGAWSSARGEQANLWANEFAAMQGARHGLALTNGTHTLEAALAACDVGEGDEVIVPALTFVATATAALAVRAKPVPVDVDAETLCIDPAAAEAAIGERTKAIVPVHIGGRPCDMDALGELCKRHGLAMVEDCAHAQGSRWRGRGAGCFGSFGSFSFESSKLITAGEGGALITDDERLRDRAWSYVNCGRVEGEHWYHHASLGSNLRMTEWQGAVLRAQTQRFPAQHAKREESARLLDEALAAVPGLRPQPGDERIDSRAYYAYIVHYDPAEFAGLSLQGFEQALAAEGIELGVSYPSLNRLELFRRDFAGFDLPRAEQASAGTLWLHHWMLLAEPDQVLDIAHAMARIQAHASDVARRLRLRETPAGRLAGALRQRLARG